MRRWVALALALAAAFAVVGLVVSTGGGRQTTPEEQVRAVATTLRCPVCAGEDVADSAAPLAESMRLVIRQRLEQGDSPDEIRQWFAGRYGDEVLLDPPRRGAGWLLWVLPLGALGAAAVLVTRGGRSWVSWVVGAGAAGTVLALWLLPSVPAPWSFTPGGEAPVVPGSGSTSSPAPVTVLRAAVEERPGSAPLRAALASRLEAEGLFEDAAHEYAALVRLQPLDADVRYRQAFALVRAGDEDAARAALTEGLLQQEDHALSLLLLGTLVQDDDAVEGRRLLSRFVEAAPDHPQANKVRTWLDQHGASP